MRIDWDNILAGYIEDEESYYACVVRGDDTVKQWLLR